MATLKEGAMYKRGKINTDWKLRTFVLTAKQLAYFKGGVSVYDCLLAPSYKGMYCALNLVELETVPA